ncbi:MAG: DUF3899 domain-containing protein [Paraclostridium sp.]
MKKFYTLISINLILSFIFHIISNFERFSLINASFMIGMLYLATGALFFVSEQGFFNMTLYSFNKICEENRRRKGVLCEASITVDDYINKRYKFNSTNPLLASGLIISITTLIISFLMYS